MAGPSLWLLIWGLLYIEITYSYDYFVITVVMLIVFRNPTT